MKILDYVFNGIFAVELVTKCISLGFVLDYGSYMRESWNKLDFVIVFFSIIDMSLEGSSFGFVKIVRLLRILRPLRFISHNPSLKNLVNCLL